MKIAIAVTEAHFDNQKRGRCTECAVALAITGSLIDGLHANVWGDSYRIEKLDGKRELTRPFCARSRAFIRWVDRGETKEDIQERFGLPFVLETDIPRKYLRRWISLHRGVFSK